MRLVLNPFYIGMCKSSVGENGYVLPSEIQGKIASGTNGSPSSNAIEKRALSSIDYNVFSSYSHVED